MSTTKRKVSVILELLRGADMAYGYRPKPPGVARALSGSHPARSAVRRH